MTKIGVAAPSLTPKVNPGTKLLVALKDERQVKSLSRTHADAVLSPELEVAETQNAVARSLDRYPLDGAAVVAEHLAHRAGIPYDPVS